MSKDQNVNEQGMKLLEMQHILGKHMRKIDSGNMNEEERTTELQDAQTIVSIAKQMINNADVSLRIELALQDGRVDAESSIARFVR